MIVATASANLKSNFEKISNVFEPGAKKEVLERRVTPNVEDIMEGRRVEVYPTESAVPAIEGINQNIAVAAPIIAAGDVSGAVVLTTSDGETAKESDIKLATVAASFLGKQMEN